MRTIELEKDNQLTKVYLPNGCLFFSYNTLIGVYHMSTYTLAINQWSRTTGKHLATISKDVHCAVNRVPVEEVHEFIATNWKNMTSIEEVAQ